MPRIRVAHALGVAGLACACGNPPPSLDTIAEGYVRVALQLAQHNPDLVESWRGADAWRPGPRVPVAGLLRTVEGLQANLGDAPPANASRDDRGRHQYLRVQLRALHFAAERQLGRAASIDEQLREEFGLEPEPFDGARMRSLRAELERVLPGTAPLAVRVAALRRRTIVPVDRRAAVIEAAITACRRATAAVIPLPPDEGVRIQWQPGLAWDGFTRYEGRHRSEIQINDDAPLDVVRAWRLACHEGYPGHHVQQVLIDVMFTNRHRPELQLTPAFGPHLLMAEGAAEIGADLAVSDDQRVSWYRDVLFPAAGLNAADVPALVRVETLLADLLPEVTDVARQYLAGAITQEAAIDRLTSGALVANPDGTLAFIERRRARALVYSEGRRAVFALMKEYSLAELYAVFTGPRGVQ
jgi:hypothetical protein